MTLKIYTRTGDKGETSLFGDVRLFKDDPRIRTYGAFDELNAVLGLILTEVSKFSDVQTRLTRVQNELFQLCSELATPRGRQLKTEGISQLQVQILEEEIDQMEADLVCLHSFILPGGERAAAMMHFARTVCRRAEREMISLNRGESLRSVLLEYVNRLGDYFFVTARYLNKKECRKDTLVGDNDN